MIKLLNKTEFPKIRNHSPKIFFIDAQNKVLGRLATQIAKSLMGKENAFYQQGIDQGNFVIVLNAKKVFVSGKKENKKFYYRNSQRPGSLKKESLKNLRERIPARILEEAIWGMLPKGVLGRNYYKRLYVYNNEEIIYKKNKKVSIFLKTFLHKNAIIL